MKDSQCDIYAFQGILKQFSAMFASRMCCVSHPTQVNRKGWRLARNTRRKSEQSRKIFLHNQYLFLLI